ncbi:ATP-binding protein [Bradyrhizobium sp. AUGA SZCCT0169]|uniref:HD domain-containing protein n=1 Tax=Bradyrhizobium sp. AUGA SZCCT0169 TaxID=2807663 RepID=UPI001BA9E66F|nr:ATP-binding protein [Bradyrhizobium sp. AUGA SZCCT0169]MBR1245320.1 ATP-binding protein [Bradyrhizobium sp. AUGA SZCCT0169]
MSKPFQKPALWIRTFEQVRPEDADKAARLQTSFVIFRERTAAVLEKIAQSLPNLTVHDITHIDALWEVSDLVAGPTYPLNPMEVFVLGGAMLLHDAALCFDAFEDGLEGIRKTVHWSDAFALEQERNKERDTRQPTSALETAADFSVVRLLHADQASNLVDRAWTDPDTSNQIFLIDDIELRKRFGSIIGQIAASHNWNIEDVQSRLPNQINAPGDWPGDWRIDPIKLACILRCADAAHIDNRRAPDYLHALTRREGISLKHWKAQNWLARADLDQSDRSGTTLAFTSNRDFQAGDAEAWWIAYDAIRLVDKEIRQSNALLGSRHQREISPEFRIQNVAGVSSPEAMGTFLRTQGWKPWHAELHVGNIERLVKNLGGQNLYGGEDKAEHFAIVLRELLQNARDAIAARKKLDQGYAGRVRVRLVDQDQSPAILEVIDDGIGMSQRVLSGPLLDFRSSFWKSDLLNEEFPGLRSSGFGSVGRYGIGFYSIFMIADSVKVSSHRWDRGLDTVASISFPKGLTLRPIFSTGANSEFNSSISTIVTCTLKSINDGRPSEWIFKRSPKQELHVPFVDFVSRLVLGLDIPVDVSVNNGDWIRAHEPVEEIVKSDDAKFNWLNNVTLAKYLPAAGFDAEEVSKRLRPLYVDGALVGLAALSLELTNAPFLTGGLAAVGGFLAGGYKNPNGQQSYIGYLDQFPNSAKREPGIRVAPQSILHQWIVDQLELLGKRADEPSRRLALTNHLCDFDFDPTPYMLALFFKGQQRFTLSIDQIFEFLKSEPIALFKWGIMDHVDMYVQQNAYENYMTFRPVGNSPFLSLELEGSVPKNPNSFIGCLYRYASRGGRSLKFETRPTTIHSISGSTDVVIVTLTMP